MIKAKKYLQYVVSLYCVIVFLSGVFPVFLMPFTGVLPYLHKWVLLERIVYFACLWALALALYLISFDSIQKKSVAATLKYSFKDWVLSFFGACSFIFIGAWLIPNNLGPLVKIFPNQPYIAEMVVLNSESKGSRNESVSLDLKSKTEDGIYYLTLSKRLFKYSNFNVGDRLILKGKQNLFGIYIEELEDVSNKNVSALDSNFASPFKGKCIMVQ